MARRVTALCLTLAAGLALAGCGGKKSADTTASTSATTASTQTSTEPTLTSAHDLAACNELGRNLRIVSGMTTDSVKNLTLALHPKELGEKTAQSATDLRYVAKVIELIDVPASLVKAQAQFVHGIRRFADDFSAAAKLAAQNRLEEAAQRLTDRAALAQVKAATDAFTRVCAPSGS